MVETILGIIALLFLAILFGVPVVDMWERDEDSLLIGWVKVIICGVGVIVVGGIIIALSSAWGRIG